MRPIAIWVAVAAVASAGCLRSTTFKCASDADCGAGGVCEAVGYCSVPNAACADTGRSFSDSAGRGLSSQCVPSQTQGPDAGLPEPDARVDGPMDAATDAAPDAAPDATVDAATDAAVDAAPDAGGPGRCPAGYAAIAGSSHLYKPLVNVSWDDAKIACAATSASAYIAVPDDASELANFAGAVAPPLWIGIDDKVTEARFVTQKNVAATFLPWAPGEPTNGPPEEDCVEAISGTEIATDRCATKHAALCECEP